MIGQTIVASARDRGRKEREAQGRATYMRENKGAFVRGTKKVPNTI